MCEGETVNGGQPQIPGVDFVVTQEQLEGVGLNPILESVTSVECIDVNRSLTSLDRERPEEQMSAIELLICLTNYNFVPDNPTEPFKPKWIMDGRRAPVPTDLLDQQIDVIVAFAPTVTHLGLRARLCDVSWFTQRSRENMAEFAIDAYCNLVEAVRDGRATLSNGNRSAWANGAKEALVRAACISRATQWKLQVSQRLRELVGGLVAAAHLDGRDDDFWRIAKMNLEYGITPPKDVVKMAEDLVENDRLSNNPDARLRLWQLAARAYHLVKDKNNLYRCMVAAAECHVQKADLVSSPMLEAHCLQNAIQILRNHPNTGKRREELTVRLREVQPRIHDEMSHFSTSVDLTEIVEQSVAAIHGHSWSTAFLSLVLCDTLPTPDEIRQNAVDLVQDFPLNSMMSVDVLDFQGRVVFRAPELGGTAAAQEERLRYEMSKLRGFFRQETVASQINPMRQTIASEHMVSSETVLELLRDSPFIPMGHEYIFARAICHFLGGQDVEAVSLLTPQLENSLRHLLALKGHDTTTANENGIQTEASLSILLNPDRGWRTLLEEIIPERYIHEIDLLFNFAGGPAVRNQIAHGKVPANRFWDHNFVYAAWLVIHMAIVHRWEGEISQTLD